MMMLLVSRIRIAACEVGEDVVVDLVQGIAAFDVNAVRIHVAGDIGKEVAGNAHIGVADVEPDAVGVPNMADHVVAEEEIVRHVHLGPGGLRHHGRILPADPLEQVLFHQS